MYKKEKLKRELSLIGNLEVFQEKQRIAIEKFGDIFEDEIFFALELTTNHELNKMVNEEYMKKNKRKKYN